MRNWLMLGAGAAVVLAGAAAGRSRSLSSPKPLPPRAKRLPARADAGRPSPNRPPTRADTVPAGLTDTTRNVLLGFVMPLWLAAGVADWLCHRKTDIEHNAGAAGSGMHLLMLSEAAVPVLAGLFLEITSPVLLLMAAAFLLHDATALWDVTYASKRRTVSPVEQHVHSYLETVPLMALVLVSVLHWPEVLALAGVKGYRRDWSIRRKADPVPGRTIVILLGAMAVLEWAPYLEELTRTLRARRRA